MKKYLFSILAVIAISALNGQVIIGGTNGIAPNKASVLLEFEGQNKGIIIPYTRTLPASPAEGTLLLDVSNESQARVKYYNGSWTDLSGQDANVASEMTIQPTSAQVFEQNNTKAIIGSNVSSAEGVLILESSTKAMVLPTVDSTDNIPDPSPGMIVYINKTGSKRLAVFNGNKWSYWMP
ncbi:Uncharacterised protein [Chryseobacterium nakagawai]|uniref:Uncharacterized protein n=1 Tax=Chryseobacterium nakagawai TaxID=1241982 RepID=A0AAD0YR73_CHRNA|nr:hypothetical protein [Chryseobacterium nakagawai]AZA93614.1 hypothetical protein EG343_24910 [Chryseobacterium nakagawai]VEH20314.1 Uncharacterised protein [Chryseobacterium nakagawai]